MCFLCLYTGLYVLLPSLVVLISLLLSIIMYLMLVPHIITRHNKSQLVLLIVV